MPSASVVIVWFQDDLRVDDHPALSTAAATEAGVLPVYVLDEESAAPWRLGGAQRWWLHHSLASLERQLAARGAALLRRRGPAPAVLSALVRESGARAVFTNRSAEPRTLARCEQVRQALAGLGVPLHLSESAELFQPSAIRSGSGEPYRVFTPFWRACLGSTPPPAPLPAVPALRPAVRRPPGDALESWRLTPTHPDWAGGIAAAWRPGTESARARLAEFLDTGLSGYAVNRDRLDQDGTSRLSAALRFGELSARRVWHAVRHHAARRGSPATQGADGFLRQLGWRAFSSDLLLRNPTLPDRPLRPAFERFPWRDDKAALAAWQQGATGYPVVDAAMRELWTTGYMHNRARMITASFLVKHLLQPWQAGAAWFWDTLVDGDLANNSANWQWVAGCGTDAAPYFRIFNPVLQGAKFDPRGIYVRRWVPELAALPDTFIHRPWQAPKAVGEHAGIRLGTTYPRPVVDHDKARARALAAFEEVKQASER
jgi:deoxyribodipyrimidine photo-lyase